MLTTSEMAGTVLVLRDVRLVRDARTILRGIDWTVRRNERWIVLGRNGSGKTTLCRIASLYLHPSEGTVEVLGKTLGRTDVRELRARIGLASAALADMLRVNLAAVDVVMTAKYGALAPWWHRYDEGRPRKRARVARSVRLRASYRSGNSGRCLLASGSGSSWPVCSWQTRRCSFSMNRRPV